MSWSPRRRYKLETVKLDLTDCKKCGGYMLTRTKADLSGMESYCPKCELEAELDYIESRF
jgi:DNA-directed RNA polymerase subunit M/transcription elongation factor TFIIS